MELNARTILIVEDEFLIRMMLAEMLSDEGFAVVEAGTGDDAIAQLRQNPSISLLLTDLSLPGMLDGLGLAAVARGLRPALPIIFVTGRPDAVPRERLSDRDAVVAKPYLPSEIVSVAHRLLAAGTE